MVAEDFEFRISYFFLGGSWGPRIREQVRKGLLNSQSISSSESVWQRGKDTRQNGVSCYLKGISNKKVLCQAANKLAKTLGQSGEW